MTHDILIVLWRATLTGSVAICAVLALRLVVRRVLGAQAAYTLWLLVPVAVLAMLLPAPARPLLEALRVAPSIVAATPTIMLDAAAEPTRLDPRPWLLAAWVAGALAMLAALTWQQRRYLRALGPLSADGEGALRAQAQNGSPALVGALFPRIVLPVDFEARFDARERELVLAHERAHLGHGDAQVNALVALLRCLQWFNPLLHFAASRLRIDQELACDARVIARFPEARRPYADAMLKAQLIGEARQELRLPIGCYWPSSHPLKERISMLKLPVPTRMRRTCASGIAIVLALASGYTSWAAQPGARASSETAIANSTKEAIGVDLAVSVDGKMVTNAQSHTENVHVMKHEGGSGLSHFEVQAGEEFVFVMKPDDRQHVRMAAVATPLPDGTIKFGATVELNGVVTSRPLLIVADGQTAVIEIGKQGPQGEFGGFRVGMTLARVATAANQSHSSGQSSSAIAATPVAATSNDDTPPSESLAFRKMLPPHYPAEAIKAGTQGKVMLKVQMDAQGVPLGTEVVSVEPKEAGVLADAAIAAAMSWRYKPGMEGGKPVGGYVLVPVDFSLSDDEVKRNPTATLPQAIGSPSYRRMRPPQYPASALAQRLTGTVWVRARLDAQGVVAEAHAEQTYPLAASELADAAVTAIQGWTFNPATVDGTPVDGEVVVPLHFAIDGYTPKATSEATPAFPPQTPLLAMVTITGPPACGKDCPPPPPPPPVPAPPPPKPAQPINAASITPAIFDIFPADDQRC